MKKIVIIPAYNEEESIVQSEIFGKMQKNLIT